MARTKTTIRIGPPTRVFQEPPQAGGAEAWIARIPQETRMLLPFVVLTLIAHIAAFYFIEITYPPTQRAIPTRTEVMLLNESTLSERERASLDFWTEINDPSRMIVPTGPLLTQSDLNLHWNGRQGFPVAPSPDNGLSGNADTSVAEAVTATTTSPEPSAARQTRDFTASMMPLLSEGWPTLQERVSQSMFPPRQEFQYPVSREAAAEPVAAKSFVVLDPDGDARLVPGSIPALPSPPYDALAALGTTVLSLGIDDSGRLRHVLIVETCGRPVIDQMAVTALRRARFISSATPGLVWTQCHVYWRFAPGQGREEKGQPTSARQPRGSGSDGT